MMTYIVYIYATALFSGGPAILRANSRQECDAIVQRFRQESYIPYAVCFEIKS